MENSNNDVKKMQIVQAIGYDASRKAEAAFKEAAYHTGCVDFALHVKKRLKQLGFISEIYWCDKTEIRFFCAEVDFQKALKTIRNENFYVVKNGVYGTSNFGHGELYTANEAFPEIGSRHKTVSIMVGEE